MSAHTQRAMCKARERGGFAGQQHVADLWRLSKRELVEVALRLAGRSQWLAEEDPDFAALSAGVVQDEVEALRAGGIL